MGEALTPVDAAWLRMDDPTNLMMVTGLLVLDKPLDVRRFRAVIERRLLTFTRFRRKVVEAPFGFGQPRWEDDRHFDLDAHLHRVALPPPGGQSELQTLVGDLMSTPLDASKPLWQLHVVEGYEGGSAVISRLHHCIADGIALIQLLLSLTDPSPRGGSRKRAAPPSDGRGGGLLEGAFSLLDPVKALGLAQVGAASALTLGRIIALPPDPATSLKGPLGVTKRAAWSKVIPLDDVKAAGRAAGATVNDVLIAAATGALRRYLEGRGEDVDGLEVRAAVPVNLRPIERGLELGNSFGLVFLQLPIGISEPRRRLAELKVRMDRIKASTEAIVAFGVLTAIGVVPKQVHPLAIDFFGSKASLVLTNVPGPREPLYLAGSKIVNNMFWVPQSGRMGLGISILSYAGGVMVGVGADAGLVPDPDAIVRGFEAELERLLKPLAKGPSRARARSRRRA